MCLCVCVCVCSLNPGAVGSRQSQLASSSAANVSVKSDPTALPTEFSRPASAPLSKVHYITIVTRCMLVYKIKSSSSVLQSE